MTHEQFERLAKWEESHNRGWLHAGNIPSCLVYFNGKEVKNVFKVHRSKGVVRVHYVPLRLDKHRKRLLSYSLYGTVALVGIQCT